MNLAGQIRGKPLDQDLVGTKVNCNFSETRGFLESQYPAQQSGCEQNNLLQSGYQSDILQETIGCENSPFNHRKKEDYRDHQGRNVDQRQ